MGVHGGPNIVTDGLVFLADATNKQSWSGPDSSTVNSLVGSVTGSIFNDTSGSFGNRNSFDFDGTDDRITTNITGDALLGSNNPYTFSAWIKPSNPESNGSNGIGQAIFGGYSHWSNFHWFGFFIKGGYAGYYYSGNSGLWGPKWDTAADTPVTQDVWQNITYTWTGTTDQTRKIYINNVLKKTQTESGGGSIVSAVLMNIGSFRYMSQNNSYFQGDIGPIQLFNRALSTQELTQNYNALKGRFGL